MSKIKNYLQEKEETNIHVKEILGICTKGLEYIPEFEPYDPEMPETSLTVKAEEGIFSSPELGEYLGDYLCKAL